MDIRKFAIGKKRRWELPESAVTPEPVYLNRRNILAGLGLGALSAGALQTGLTTGAAASDDPTADLYPAALNPKFADAGRPVTPQSINEQYNNFYEFGSHKQIAYRAQSLQTRPWTVEINGLVEKPQTVDIDTLIRAMPLEERIIRHRCVEAWSMVVPWTGFPVSELVKFAKPLGSAKYIEMQTFMNPQVATGQRQGWYPWPYTEGLTMDEAMNELSFMVTGAYGAPMAKQFGAPVRLHLPWKYGFKSVKSIVRITFTEERPKTFWETVLPNEYGFWANVNPEVNHPRWSQATERDLNTGDRIPTKIFNGYGEWVADLYKDLPASERPFV